MFALIISKALKFFDSQSNWFISTVPGVQNDKFLAVFQKGVSKTFICFNKTWNLPVFKNTSNRMGMTLGHCWKQYLWQYTVEHLQFEALKFCVFFSIRTFCSINFFLNHAWQRKILYILARKATAHICTFYSYGPILKLFAPKWLELWEDIH